MAQAAEVLELPLDEVGQLRQQLSVLKQISDQQREQLTDMEQQVVALRHKMDAEAYKTSYLRHSVRELAEVRQRMLAGDPKEALYLLERTLSVLDSAWRVYA